MGDKKVIKGNFKPRLNIGVSAGISYPYENDEMMLLRLETDVAGKKSAEYHVIMKDEDSEN